MPLVCIASAVCSISDALTLQPNAFQSLKPIGGVGARPLYESARAGAATSEPVPSTSSAAVRQLNSLRIPAPYSVGWLTRHGLDAMPFVTTWRSSAPRSRPAGTSNCVVTTWRPVATPIELWSWVRA